MDIRFIAEHNQAILEHLKGAGIDEAKLLDISCDLFSLLDDLTLDTEGVKDFFYRLRLIHKGQMQVEDEDIDLPARLGVVNKSNSLVYYFKLHLVPFEGDAQYRCEACRHCSLTQAQIKDHVKEFHL